MQQPFSDIIIRLANSEDAEIIVDIQYYAIRYLSANDYNYRQLNALLRSKSLYRKSREIIFIAEVNNQVIGFASLIYPFNTIGGIFVDPFYVRRGVGTKLLQRLEQEAIANNISVLWVSSSLTGYPFYLANDYFTVVRTNFPLYSTYIPVIHMKKRLLPTTKEEVFRETYQLLTVMVLTAIMTALFL